MPNGLVHEQIQEPSLAIVTTESLPASVEASPAPAFTVPEADGDAVGVQEGAARQLLSERFKDTVVTYMGITATMGQLDKLCPVPPSQRDPVKMERWAADILIGSGIDIAEVPKDTTSEPNTNPAAAKKKLLAQSTLNH